jgi:hypothetical protein
VLVFAQADATVPLSAMPHVVAGIVRPVYGANHEICWCLRYGVTLGPVGKPLDEAAEELQLRTGMLVTLFYVDESEEFEVSAVLEEDDRSPANRWRARADWNTFRRIRG